MTETEFVEISENIFATVEEWLEDSDLDLDLEAGAGMLTIRCEENGSQIILSRQRAVAEIWVAAISGGFHFSWQGSDWICKTGENLTQLLNRVLLEQAGAVPEQELVLND